MGDIYIYNRHIAPITCNARDGKGAIVFTKKFEPERVDGTTGRVVHTGYTALTGEEHDRLCESSRTFAHYKDDLGLLTVCEDLPPEARTPQEALSEARRSEREARDRAAAFEAENLELQAALAEIWKERDALKAELAEMAKKGDVAKTGKDGKAKEFA
jgi:hypothetical protein